MTMFGPWYDPENDPSSPPWPGFDPVRIVTALRASVLVLVPILLGLATFAIMKSLAP